MHALAFAFANLFRSDDARSPEETGASLCGQIHGVYRYLYVRGLAFHNQFSKVTSTTTAWASRFCTLLSAPGSEVTFLLCAFKDSRCFSAPYTCTSGLHSSLARMFYSLFLLLCFDTSIGAFHYYCLFTVNARNMRINIKMTIEMIRPRRTILLPHSSN